ncbi:hypothetical protein [Salinicoccus halodurans]|uniref:Uncharacterized protein n=1 Tax=Salinicoccus halodurans TaxID=407035 RepID=A0A0F7HL56_9STAP|nr:hypothetical protein [Salinicoccus halodurans]AKG73576.1 hypothetical protein AAT16_04715 [Salinicoccus halodurans]SFK52830.1 hypothetical protein SAMN05216235_0179 [Salinicoccus halodurans]
MDKVNFKSRKHNLLMAALALALFIPQNDALATTEVPPEGNTSQEFTPANDGTNQNPSAGEVPSTEEVPAGGGQSEEVPSNEIPAEEEVPADGGESYPEASTEVPAEEENTAGTGVNSPYINNVSVSGQSFEPGDLVTVTIEGTSGSVLSGATATFERSSSSGTAAIDISSFDITDYGNGNFSAVATYQLPDDLGDATYSLTGVTLADQAGSYNTISNENMNFNTGFEVVSPVPEDTTPPNLVTMYTDKDVYAPGETVTVTVEAEDESEISQMWGAFADANGSPENDPYRLDNIYITQNPLGNYVGVGTFTIGEDVPNATYGLNFVGISDVQGNESYFNQYDFGVFFDIMNEDAAETAPPELVDVSADEESYQAGDAASIEVTAADESEIIGVTADFVVEGEEDGQVYSTDLASIEQDKEGNYIASTEIQLPEKLAGKKIQLTDITIVDVYENVGKYNAEDDELDLAFGVTEAEDSENVPGDGVAGPGESGGGDGAEEEDSEEIAADDQTKGGFLSGSGLFSENVLLPVAVLVIFLCTVLFVILPLRKKG